MATLQTSQGGAPGNRLRKHVPAIDLTAMVDLAFLLITFFMLTTTLSRYQAMDVARPVPSDDGPRAHYPASRTLTLVLGKKDQVMWYMGEPSVAAMAQTPVSAVRKVLLARKNELLNKQKDLIVIIKPAAEARYANLVDVLDELQISKVKTYVIDDADNALLEPEVAGRRRLDI